MAAYDHDTSDSSSPYTGYRKDEIMEEKNVIWISSYPKSGNTWIHSVIRLAGKNYGFPQSDLDVYNMLSKNQKPQANPCVASEFENNPCVVLKTHSPWKANEPIHAFKNLELVNTAYIHVYRNPLDVLLSYINFTRLEYEYRQDNENYKKFLFLDLLGFDEPITFDEWQKMSIDTLPKEKLDNALNYFTNHSMRLKSISNMASGWIHNNESWLLRAKRAMHGISISYEDCVEKPEIFLQVCPFFKFTEQDILAALQTINQKAQVASKQGNSNQKVFYNKMSAFYFKDYFSEHIVGRFIETHKEVLQRFGYFSALQEIYI